MELIGYARVSTADQNLGLQLKALKEAGCVKTFEEKISTRAKFRPELMAALEYARTGDVIVVWRLDRLGRSLIDLVKLVELFKSRGIGLKSLTQDIDTTSATGRLIFHIFAALAEFERESIRERTLAGLAAAKEKGRTGGRRKQISSSKIDSAIQLAETTNKTIDEICSDLNISRASYYRLSKQVSLLES